MKITKVKNRGILFTFDGYGWDLNLYLILGRKYNYIIDTGLGSDSVSPIKEYIKNDNKPIIVINTHYHWDHIWGNNEFKDRIIISHKLCRDLIEKNWEYMMERNEKYISGEVKICLPNLVFENELYFPEDKIRLIYTPGHTDDSISIIDEEEKVLNVADNIGDTVEEIIPSIFGNKEDYIQSLEKYKRLYFDTCVSGHNVILKKDVFDIISEKFKI
jgi:glyoxylase-like metal-dependent hydrolase (beta-lactamase superfamily II)